MFLTFLVVVLFNDFSVTEGRRVLYENVDYIPSESYNVPVRIRRFYPQNRVPTFGYFPELIGGFHHGFDGFGYGYGHGHGGGSGARSDFNSGNQRIGDGNFNRDYGKSIGNLYYDRLGYNGDKISLYDSNRNLGLYFDRIGGQNKVEDQRAYAGGNSINQAAENSDEQKQKSFRKKGHTVKGFKNSHHSDEEGKDEEYYDEEYDRGDSRSYKSEAGNEESSGQLHYKGVNGKNYYDITSKENVGQYDDKASAKKEISESDQHGAGNSLSKGNVYGSNSGIDAQSLLGHQESGDYHKKYHHTPFFIH